ncbi:MAG: hypothetical protein KAG53_04490 [Endozoicomonadaceae bacterium]|nr:hypothetical protein [Endozoicomonadaceae bacterium]
MVVLGGRVIRRPSAAGSDRRYRQSMSSDIDGCHLSMASGLRIIKRPLTESRDAWNRSST